MDLKEELFHEGQRIAAKIKLAEAKLTEEWDELNDEAKIAAQDAIAELEDQLVKIRNKYDDIHEDADELYDIAESFSAKLKAFIKEHKWPLLLLVALVALLVVLIVA